MGEVGVPDMVTISDIDEFVINKNLKKRYSANKIYVSINIIYNLSYFSRSRIYTDDDDKAPIRKSLKKSCLKDL